MRLLTGGSFQPATQSRVQIRLAPIYTDDRIRTVVETPNLWSQVENVEGPFGPRLSGEPEIVHETQDFLREQGIPISRAQIQIILESVPDVFPEGWLDPGTFEQLSDKQKEVGYKIIEANPKVRVYGLGVQKVIEFAVSYRNQFGQKTK